MIKTRFQHVRQKNTNEASQHKAADMQPHFVDGGTEAQGSSPPSYLLRHSAFAAHKPMQTVSKGMGVVCVHHILSCLVSST